MPSRDRRPTLDPRPPHVCPALSRKSLVAPHPSENALSPSSRYPPPALVPAVKRSPLAPLDLQLSPGQAKLCGGGVPDSDADPAASPRKHSIASANSPRASRHLQRPAPRRQPSSGSVRRSSLHTPQPHNSSIASSPSAYDMPTTQDNDIYSGLSTYSFGDARISGPTTSHVTSDDLELISPLQKLDQTTPRPSLAIPGPSSSTHTLGWSSASDDEDEERRSSTRAKMRALDGGARRPSLPINEQSQSSFRPRRTAQDAYSSSSPITDGESNGLESDRLSIEFDTDSDAMAVDAHFDYIDSRRLSTGTFGGIHTSPIEAYNSEDGHNGDRVSWNDTSGRRGSQPMAIPSAKSNSSSSTYHTLGQAADGHILLAARRPSRSVDEDLMSANVEKAATRNSMVRRSSTQTGIMPSSEPDMRGLAMAQAHEAVRQQIEEQVANMSLNKEVQESPYEGLDLNYILSGSLSPHSFGPDDSSDRPHARVSGQSWTRGWDIANSRRQSSATVDDTFLKYVKRHDPLYQERKGEWSFVRERADGQGTVSRRGETEKTRLEYWRCTWVGRYRVERTVTINPDHSKPSRVRLSVRHIPDPFSKGYTRGGPLTYVHKHSRAKACSLYRGYTVPDRHLKSENSILLAPRKVQEQFTSTRTTSQLRSHGLLEEEPTPHPSTSQSNATPSVYTTAWSRQTSSRPSTRPTSSQGDGQQSSGPSRGASEDRELPGKGKAKATQSEVESVCASSKNTAGDSTSSMSNSTASANDAGTDTSFSSAMSAPGYPPSSYSISKPSERGLQRSATTSSVAHSNYSAASSGTRGTDKRDLMNADRQPYTADWSRMSVGSIDGDKPIVRTSHAEAFAVLDTPTIEYYRNRHLESFHGALEDASPSRFKALRKLFQGQPIKTSTAKHTTVPSGPHTAVLEANYAPPWVTLAKRDQLEEQERMIKNLNDSFRDVGLLPASRSSKPRSSKSTRHPKKTTTQSVFAAVPDESLFMLLPMWPAESDLASQLMFENPATCDIPLYDRQYLLLYYAPQASGKPQDKGKKRPRQHAMTSSRDDEDPTLNDRTSVHLVHFNILGRLVSHKDVNGSGIRVPTHGLSVTGPLVDAIAAIPQIRFQMDDLTVLLGFCDNRDRTIEFLPEAAEKLGLCVPRPSAEPDPDQPEVPLSSIGRAAVEMAWLGALAVMGMNAPTPP